MVTSQPPARSSPASGEPARLDRVQASPARSSPATQSQHGSITSSQSTASPTRPPSAPDRNANVSVQICSLHTASRDPARLDQVQPAVSQPISIVFLHLCTSSKCCPKCIQDLP
ncbi:hypothetical protein K440DRAFT_18269 [Wilcoxina mikolae CBS 423.85]|nr:hypothetical protein K440DRAFT_18269 [Wilcoxina mikolae CBS 423.85]